MLFPSNYGAFDVEIVSELQLSTGSEHLSHDWVSVKANACGREGGHKEEEGSFSGCTFKLSFIVPNRVWVSGEEKVTKKNRNCKENEWI